MPRSPLSNRYRTALVTGAGSGLGRAFSGMLVAEGVEVWGTSRRPETLSANGRLHSIGFDLGGGRAAAEALIAQVEHASGGLDLLVHNAGYGVFGSVVDEAWPVWQRQIDEMLTCSVALNRAALASMGKRGKGGIVNVTSMAVEFPIPFMAGYNIAKAGLAALTESLMLEQAAAGIAFIDFRPGDHRTAFNSSMFTTPPDRMPAVLRRVAQRLDATLAAAPLPDRAARNLRGALVRGRSGVVRSGSFFQTVLAPFGVRFLPLSWRRAAMSRYFGVR